MLRKFLSKLTAPFKSAAPKRAETAKPAHGTKPVRTGGRDSHSQGQGQGRPAEKRRPHGDAPRPAASHSRPAPHAQAPAQAPRAAAAPKPLPEVPKLNTTFSALGLGDRIAYAVQQKGYENPTPIQAQAIPVVLAGKDVIGSAQTGTGKTAAFSLPILQRLGTHGKIRCLVLEPTREIGRAS